MVAISDKFGKASSSGNTSGSTTVKTARSASGTTLACNDLSVFSQDTPVYGVTYKKTVDPVTNKTSITDKVAFKALVTIATNTLTNFTVDDGYTDAGNDVGDYVECIPTTHWADDLVDGILASHNANGLIKTVEGGSVKFSTAASQPVHDPNADILWFKPLE